MCTHKCGSSSPRLSHLTLFNVFFIHIALHKMYFCNAHHNYFVISVLLFMVVVVNLNLRFDIINENQEVLRPYICKIIHVHPMCAQKTM